MIGDAIVNALVTGLPLVPLFLGIYMVLILREDFDLTVNGSYALGGGVAAILLVHGWGLAVAGLAAIVSAGLAGAVTATLHLLLRVPVLLAGLVMNLALFTITLTVMGVPTVSLVGQPTIFGFTESLGLGANSGQIAVLLLVLLVLMTLFGLFLKTELGLALRASGRNTIAVRSQGVSDRRLVLVSLISSNGLCGLSGFLMIQVQSFSDVNMGLNMFISGIGAVLLGSLILRPEGSKVVRIVLAVVVGTFLYRFILVLCLSLGLPAGDLNGITALTLVVAIAAQTYLTPALSKLKDDAGRVLRRTSRPQRDVTNLPSESVTR